MTVAALFAVDPAGTGGIVLRGPPGPVRDGWMAQIRAALPDGAPVCRVPLHVGEDRLLGGLDLAATLRAGRPCVSSGLLAEAEGGVLVLAMAERIGAGTVGRITAALDASPPLGVVALDEGFETAERVADPLSDRLAFHVTLEEADGEPLPCRSDVAAARERLAAVTAGEDVVEGLCMAAAALGITSVRAALLALRVARAACALAGRHAVSAEDAALAARLVLAPRATALPAPPPPHDEPDAAPEPGQDEQSPQPDAALADTVLNAAAAALPPGLLALLRDGAVRRSGPAGRKGAATKAARHGRAAGTRAGCPGGGLRLSLIETLRAAAPWQRLRAQVGAGTVGIQVRREDFRVTRLKAKAGTTTIFLVDASGSHAANRMAEAKGAVQLLLADCYVRRDQVAVLAFRGRSAEVLLPPTRSLVRAKRSLAGLPGGGGTPLAAGIEAGGALAGAVRRRGGMPALVLLTDGRANVGRDGKGGRPTARSDAEGAARRIRADGHPAILIDTSPRPNGDSRQLAEVMGARYLPLPHASSAGLADAVRSGR